MVDLDGVMWLAGHPITGAPEAVAALRRAGAHLVFATNNASPTKVELVTRLAAAGVAASTAEIVSSADAVARMLQPKERVLVVGEEGLFEALESAGAEPVAEDPNSVVVARTPHFEYATLEHASQCVRGGARLIGTSEDPTHPTPEGLVPGTGSLLAAVATASGTRPVVAGKPHDPMCALLRDRVGKVDVVVGDRPDTDGTFAQRLGARFALVYSGATSPGATRELDPDATGADFLTLVRATLDARAY